MTWAVLILLALVWLFFSAFFSGAETGLYRINRVRLHLDVQKRRPHALRLSSVLDDDTRALSVTLVGTNVANYFFTATVAYAFTECLHYDEIHSQLYTVALATPIVFVFGEMVPKNLFQLHADALLARGSRLLVLADRLLKWIGISWALKRIVGTFGRLARVSGELAGGMVPKRRVTALLQEAITENVMGEEQSDLITRVCGLSETPLYAVMIPRNRVTVVAASTSRKGLLRTERRTGHAQLPVYETNRRQIVGTVKVDELLQDDTWETVGQRMKRATTLRPHQSVAYAISHLQRTGSSLAVIVDRGGQMIGIVTLKDLLAEVLGGLALSV